MAQISFRFAALEPQLLHPEIVLNNPIIEGGSTAASKAVIDDLVLDVQRAAPEGAPRPVLRTRVYARSDTPKAGFNAFSVTHDEIGHYDAYAGPDDGRVDTIAADEVIRKMYIGPIRFFTYELSVSPGHLYATTSTDNLKEMFRRYRATNNRQGAIFRRRVVDIRALEATLSAEASTETTGYTFSNVQSDTAITRMSADGQQIGDNDEVQDVKERAETIKAIRFDFQLDDVVLRMSIDENGTVKFSKNPGDEPALDALHQLNTYIESHSHLVTVTVGQGRSG